MQQATAAPRCATFSGHEGTASPLEPLQHDRTVLLLLRLLLPLWRRAEIVRPARQRGMPSAGFQSQSARSNCDVGPLQGTRSDLDGSRCVAECNARIEAPLRRRA